MKIDPGLERSLADVKRTWKSGKSHFYYTFLWRENLGELR